MNTTSADNSSFSLHDFTDFGSTDLTSASLSINLILGFPLNGFVMWLILTSSKESIASDFFSLNLATSELLFCLSSLWFFVFVETYSIVAINAYMFSLGLLFTARPLFQCCICMEYYAGVIHPVLYLKFKPLRYRFTCCCVVWLLTLLSCIFYRFTFTNSVYLYVYYVESVLMLCVMLFCSLSVLRALKRPSPGDKDKGKKKKSNKMKRKAFKIIVLIMTFMTMNFFLYMVVFPLQCCLDDMMYRHVFSIFSSIAMSTAFIQPLLYLHRSGKLPCLKKI